MGLSNDAGGAGAPIMSGAELTAEYLRLLSRYEVPTAELTAAAAASDVLAVGYRDRFLARPIFLGAAEVAGLVADLRAVHELLADLPRRLFAGSHAAFVRAVGITPIQQTVTERMMGDNLPPLGRADLYRAPDGFKLLEFNLTSSLGGFENTDINRAMLTHPLLADFVAQHGLGFVDTLRALVTTIITSCADNIRGDRPVIALLDWPESFVSYEPRLRVVAGLMARMGVEAVPCHLGQLRERDGRLEVDGRPIDIVYRFFVVKEIVTEADAALMEPLLRMVERGAVGMCTSIGADTYGSKGALAMLSDDRHRSAFSHHESALIDRFLPWTRHLRKVGTDPGGQEVQLADYARANQSDLILKPSLDYGGAGIIPGWTVGADEWSARLDELLDSGYILQQRVRPVAESFPNRTAAGTDDLYLNLGVFFLDKRGVGAGDYAGCLLRGTTDPDAGVVSLGSGALVGCCFHAAGEAS